MRTVCPGEPGALARLVSGGAAGRALRPRSSFDIGRWGQQITMYIGLGTIILILVIIAVVSLLRRGRV